MPSCTPMGLQTSRGSSSFPNVKRQSVGCERPTETFRPILPEQHTAWIRPLKRCDRLPARCVWLRLPTHIATVCAARMCARRPRLRGDPGYAVRLATRGASGYIRRDSVRGAHVCSVIQATRRAWAVRLPGGSPARGGAVCPEHIGRGPSVKWAPNRNRWGPSTNSVAAVPSHFATIDFDSKCQSTNEGVVVQDPSPLASAPTQHTGHATLKTNALQLAIL